MNPSEGDRVLSELRPLAYGGQPEAAVARATALLAQQDLPALARAHLLDLRSDVLLATGEIEAAERDVDALGALARAMRDPAVGAVAARRESFFAFRRNQGERAIRAGRESVALARECGDALAIAKALMQLAIIQTTLRADQGRALEHAREALRIVEGTSDEFWKSRAWLSLAQCHVDRSEVAKAEAASDRASALASRSGDLWTQAQALNLRGWFEGDQVRTLKLRQQALACYEAAGHVHGRAIMIGNVAAQAVNAGLFRRGRRLCLEAQVLHDKLGNKGPSAANLSNLF